MEKGLTSQTMDRHFVLKTRKATTEVCGGLNKNGPHRLIGNDTFRRCGPVGIGTALLEEMYHGGVAL